MIPLLLLLLACSSCRPPPVGTGPDLETPEEAGLRALPTRAGEIRGKRYHDDTRPFSISVPEDWRARIGASDSPLRLSLRHESTGARIRIFAGAPGPLEPADRRGCSWTFEADGYFRALPDTGEVHVATCTPDDPGEARIFAYLLIRDGWLWQIEVHTPASGMVQAKQRADGVLRTLRW